MGDLIGFLAAVQGQTIPFLIAAVVVWLAWGIVRSLDRPRTGALRTVLLVAGIVLAVAVAICAFGLFTVASLLAQPI